MTGTHAVSEAPAVTAAPTPSEAPLDLATTLSRPRRYVKAVLRLLVQRWDPFLPPTEDQRAGDLRFTKVAVEDANARLLQVVVRYLKRHGEFFLGPGPHYLDRERGAIYRLHPKAAFPVLFPLGFRATERCYQMLAANLYEHVEHGDYPRQKVHHFAYMSPEAVYLWSASNRMLKITSSAIEEVGIGTDDVLLQAQHIAPFPSLDELKQRIEALRPRIGDAVTKLIPGTSLSDLYTTCWSSQSRLNAQQAQLMAFTRFLFVPAASRYRLWPLVLITGPEDSDKSTLLEIGSAFFTGKHEEIVVDPLPREIDSFYASVRNTSYLNYDNIDDPKRTGLTSAYHDLICQLAIGAKRPIRDNEKHDYPVKVHASFTAIACPFERSDVMRRCLHFEVTNTDQKTDKMRS